MANCHIISVIFLHQYAIGYILNTLSRTASMERHTRNLTVVVSEERNSTTGEQERKGNFSLSFYTF